MKIVLLTALLAFSTVQVADTAFAQQMTKQEIKAQMKAEKAQKKKEKEKSSSSSVVTPAPKPVVVVTPAPVAPAPTPAPVTPTPAPAPKPVIDAYTQSQIDKALSRPQVHPLANCTYCAAYAASIGDFDLVNAIGAPYTPPATSTPAPAAPATEAPAPAAESAPAETSTPATESAPADAPAATENTVTQ